MGKVQTVIDSDGSVSFYPDIYGEVTDDDVLLANKIETTILERTQEIKKNYLVIGQLLAKFKQENLYLASGYATFKAWIDGPESGEISYRTAQRLIQIATEALPVLEKAGKLALAAEIGISTMANLLPILNDENGEETFVEAAERVKDLTSRDAKAEIKSIRGFEEDINKPLPTIFMAKLRRGESFHSVKIVANTGNDTYDVGTLRIKPSDWARWEQRFGRFLSIEE